MTVMRNRVCLVIFLPRWFVAPDYPCSNRPRMLRVPDRNYTPPIQGDGAFILQSGSSDGVAVHTKMATINKLRPKPATAEQLRFVTRGVTPVTGQSHFPSGRLALFRVSTAGFRLMKDLICEYLASR